MLSAKVIICQKSWLVALILSLGLFSSSVQAQVEPPEREFLFIEDRYQRQREVEERRLAQERRRQLRQQQLQLEGMPFDINATNIDFDSSQNKVFAEGNVVITYSSGIIESERATYDVKTNIVELERDIRITQLETDLTAESAAVNLETNAATLDNAHVYLSEGDYQLFAKHVAKSPEDQFKLTETTLTTCRCPEADSCPPWRMYGERAKITKEGYGQIWNTSVYVLDYPVLYLPYLIFPAKSQRQSGLLPARFGTGRRSGFEIAAPFFWAINESADATITPILQTKVRTGVDTEYRQLFRADHSLEFGVTYLNDSARGDDLMGTNITGLHDPTFDTNRFGGYVAHTFQPELFGTQFQYILNGHYVSDDLFLREYKNEKIGRTNARFVTSRAALRTTLLDRYSAEVTGEYNQAIVDDDDFIFQRFPQATLSGLDVFRPFGANPYGAKVVLGSQLSTTTFTRKRGFEGNRTEIYERARLPFNYKNYFDGQFDLTARGSIYSLVDNQVVDRTSNEVIDTLDDQSTRFIPSLGYRTSTLVERVFSVDEGNVIKRLADLGRIGRAEQLVRVKHTVEPTVRYLYVPEIDQSNNPQFDSSDRLAKRNVVTYGLTQRLFGRYEPLNEYIYGIEEIAPRFEDLEPLQSQTIIDDELEFGYEGADPSFEMMRKGSVRELAVLQLTQSFDINAQRDEIIETKDAFSDIAADLILLPNEHARFRARTNFDATETSFSSYSLEGQFVDKWGDELRARLSYVEDRVRQLESSVQVNLTDFLKLGYYTRYDDLSSTFIEQRIGVRMVSTCRCWVLDVDLTDRINPDETKVAFNLTLLGLGEIGNTFFTGHERRTDR